MYGANGRSCGKTKTSWNTFAHTVISIKQFVFFARNHMPPVAHAPYSLDLALLFQAEGTSIQYNNRGNYRGPAISPDSSNSRKLLPLIAETLATLFIHTNPDYFEGTNTILISVFSWIILGSLGQHLVHTNIVNSCWKKLSKMSFCLIPTYLLAFSDYLFTTRFLKFIFYSVIDKRHQLKCQTDFKSVVIEADWIEDSGR